MADLFKDIMFGALDAQVKLIENLSELAKKSVPGKTEATDFVNELDKQLANAQEKATKLFSDAVKIVTDNSPIVTNKSVKDMEERLAELEKRLAGLETDKKSK